MGRPRKDSPRNSPLLGRPPKKNSLSSPVVGRPPKKHSLPLPDKQSPGETKPKRGRPKSRFSLDAADGKSQICWWYKLF